MFLLPVLLLVIQDKSAYAQGGDCGPNVPYYSVDLTGNPGGTWVSDPPIVRQGNCCGTSNPDRCIEFGVTLDSAAVAISFSISSGAVPPGALFYQINCGPPTPVGEAICVDGVGPHYITFCKPGANLNTYAITSIPEPSVSPGSITTLGCSITMEVYGLIDSLITWTDITSGTGEYNAYLDCTSGCSVAHVSPLPGYPDYVDYMVCGIPESVCAPPEPFCDTIRVNFIPPIENDPIGVEYCENNPGILIGDVVNGGMPPYNFIWTDAYDGLGSVVGTDSTYFALTPGDYSVVIQDATYPDCPEVINNITVTESPMPTVDAGADQFICEDQGSVSLNGIVTGATGGYWHGGLGLISPNDSVLSVTYTPTADEIANGMAQLILETTGNGACNPVLDTVNITISPVINISLDAPSIICYGETTDITSAVTGGIPPYSYLWSNGATTANLNDVGAGTYTLTVVDANPAMCNATATVTLNENPYLELVTAAGSIMSCSITTNIDVTANGGTPGYSYAWSNGLTDSSIVVISGEYSVTLTDAVGCTDVDSMVIIAPTVDLTATIPEPENLCYGSTTEITATAFGGFGNYTYAWNTGETDSTITVPSGIYCVTVSDDVGCLFNSCITVVIDSLLEIEFNVPDIICLGDSTSITSIVTGGQAPYNYLWSTGDSDTSVFQPAGTYTLTITDSNPNVCEAEATLTVNEATQLVSSLTPLDVSCFSYSDGQASVSVSGSVPPYNYVWSSSSTLDNITGVPAGYYYVTITDSINCSIVDSVEITEPLLLEISISDSADALCYGSADGSATAIATGGTLAYEFSWSPIGGTDAAATSLPADNYTVSVTDANACTASTNVIIAEPPDIILSNATTNVSCFGGADGNTTVNASGGTPPFEYLWSDGQTSQTATGLAAGTYSVTVTDSHLCTETLSVTVTEPLLLTAVIDSSSDVSCFGGNDGYASVLVQGGTMPYSYNWTPFGGTAYSTDILSEGSYTVNVTDSLGCTTSASVTINQNPLLQVEMDPTSLISCDSTITIDIQTTGGDGSYSFIWSNGVLDSTSLVVNSGTYSVTVTDGEGCTHSDTTTVVAYNSTLAAEISGDELICDGASEIYSVTITPGESPYSYDWSTGETTEQISFAGGDVCVTITDGVSCVYTNCMHVEVLDPVVVSVIDTTVCVTDSGFVSASAIGGAPSYTFSWSSGENSDTIYQPLGTYSVTVTDSIGCVGTALATVANHVPLAFAYNYANISCNEGNDGFIESSISGGIEPYHYIWSDSSTDEGIYFLPDGTYSLTVTDEVGCSAVDSVTLTQPDQPLLLDSVIVHVSCYGGSDGYVEIVPSGATPPYDIMWSPGSSQNSYLVDLPIGTYTAFVSDSLGCYESMALVVEQPTPVQATIINQTNASCFGFTDGAAEVQAGGGTPPYAYIWSDGIANDSVVSGLSAGSYQVTVYDAQGCPAIKSFTITEPPLFSAVSGGDVEICFGDDTQLQTTLTNGIAPVSYSWSPSEGLSDTSLSNPIAAPNVTTSYEVTISDANGCIAQAATLVTVHPLPEVVITGDTAYCPGFGVVLDAGAGYNTYNWSTGDITQSAAINSPGTYYVTVTDVNACTDIGNFEVFEYVQPAILLVGDGIDCYGGIDGSIELSVDAGLEPFTYLWDNASTTQNLSNLSEGQYCVTATDANSCTVSECITLTQPQFPLEVTLSVTDVDCYGASTGAIISNVTGGTAPYEYIWSDGSTSNNLSGIPSDLYSLTVTDANDCVVSVSDSVLQPTPIQLVDTVSPANCGQSDGSVYVGATGGTGQLSFEWSTGGTDNYIENVPASVYTVSITDENNCLLTSDFSVSNEPGPNASIIDYTNPSCNGFNNGTATVEVQGGTSPYTYLWGDSLAQTTVTAGNLYAGVVWVTVTDTNNCSDYASIELIEPLAISTNFSTYNPTCFGYSVGWATVMASGGTPPYDYQWTSGGGGLQDSINTGLSEGTYEVLVSDSLQCEYLSSVNIIQPDPVIFAMSAVAAGCYDSEDGSANVYDITGGTPGADTAYTVLWDSLAAFQTTMEATGLGFGNYCVTVTDGNGCTESGCIDVQSPLPISIPSITYLDVECFGDSTGGLNIVVDGGTPEYSYYWEDSYENPIAGNYSDLTGLSAGVYFVTITDASNCTSDTSIIVSQPPPINLSIDNDSLLCHGYCDGSLTATVSGGQQPYTYFWSDLQDSLTAIDLCGGKYYFSLTDNAGCSALDSALVIEPEVLQILGMELHDATCGVCNGTAKVFHNGDSTSCQYDWGIPGENSSFVDSLCSGLYQLFITSENGCIADTSFTISDLNGPEIVSTSAVEVSCYGFFDGEASIIYDESTPPAGPYELLWSNGGTNDSIFNLGAGEYSVTVSDTNQCISTAIVLIESADSMNTAITYTDDADCYGVCNGSATVQATGGTPGYTYLWDSGQTYMSPIDLCAGIHVVTITDVLGCYQTDTVYIGQPDPLSITALIQDVTCNGFSNGSIVVNAEGGAGVYNYNWPHSGASVPSVGSLSAGQYTIEVADQLAPTCMIDSTFTVSEPDPISVVINTTPETCNSDNGTATIVSTEGGSGSYTFQWSGTSGYPVATGLSSGTNYLLQIFDNADNSCVLNENVNVGSVPIPEMEILSSSGPSCHDFENGQISVEVLYGSAPYSFSWFHPDPDSIYAEGLGLSSLTNLPAGLYTVELTDNDGCQSLVSVNLENPTLINLVGTGGDTICYGQSVQLSATATGGTAPYTYYWSGDIQNNGQVQMVYPESSEDYQITVVDANGCESTTGGVISVIVRPPLAVNITGDTLICEGDSLTLTAFATGGNGTYSYSWSNTSTSYSIETWPHFTDTYSVTVTDEDMCSEPAEDQILVTLVPAPGIEMLIDKAYGCQPTEVQFFNEVNQEYVSYYWAFDDPESGIENFSNDPSPIHIYENPGLYNVYLTLTNAVTGCSADYSFTDFVQVFENPQADFRPVPEVADIIDPDILFSDLSIDAVSWFWQFGDGAISFNSNPTHVYHEIGIFDVNLLVTSEDGCIDTITHPIEINPVHTFYAPTAFFPRPQGFYEENGFWTPEATGVSDCSTCYDLYIFDRWGEIIFETHEFYGHNPSEENRWNGRVRNHGKIVQNGVYTWYVELVDINGKEHIYIGPVTVLR